MSNNYGQGTNFQGAANAASGTELFDTEKTAKNSTTSVLKQTEDLTQKPIQPEANENKAEKDSSSVQPKPEDDKYAERSEQVSPESEYEYDEEKKALKEAIHILGRHHYGEKVGYKNPPKKYQFKKGQSGNPKGRPKKPKPKTLKEAMILTLNGDIKSMKKVNIEDLPIMSAVAMSLCKAALEGKFSAIKWLYEHYELVDLEFIVNGMQEREIEKEFEPTPEEYRQIREHLLKLCREYQAKEELEQSQLEENHNLNKTNQEPY